MSVETGAGQSELIYGLEDKPSPKDSMLAAMQHFMAMFVGIIAPPLIIGRALGFDPELTGYLVNMGLLVSGIGTFLQTRTFGPVGSGLLSVQGTSFVFVTAIISIVSGAIASGKTPSETLAIISGLTIIGSLVMIVMSRFATFLRKVFPPIVSGITILIIGLSLVKVGMTDFLGGFASKAVVGKATAAVAASKAAAAEAAAAVGTETAAATAEIAAKAAEAATVATNIAKATGFAGYEHLLMGTLVLGIIVFLNRLKHPLIRMTAILVGLTIGYSLMILMGKVNLSSIATTAVFNMPIPFKYGIAFDWTALLSISLLYVLCAVEGVGDLAAVSILSKQPVKGETFVKRLKGGILADGIASLIAGVFHSFPSAIFAQNNGVIQMTGVASRHVGQYIAGFLFIAGLFPIVGKIFALIPPSVLGGATLLLFGSVAAAGIKILSTLELNRRDMLIIALSLGVGLGSGWVPEIATNMPSLLKELFHSAVTAGGMTAVIANLLIPEASQEIEKPLGNKGILKG